MNLRALYTTTATLLFVAGITACTALDGSDVADETETTASSEAGFSAFAQKVHFEPAGPGRASFYMFDEDLVAFDERELEKMWKDAQPARSSGAGEGEALTVGRYSTGDVTLSRAESSNITYCVSNAFGPLKAQVVEAMAFAANAWMNAADVRFRYVPAEDARCTNANANVYMDVQPITNRPWVAKAPLPRTPRNARSILINTDQIFTRLSVTGAGTLRHELGHVLGLRHEHENPNRDDAVTRGPLCVAFRDVRAVTDCDRYSVMGYLSCGGIDRGQKDNFCLSPLDKVGIPTIYGPSKLTTKLPEAPSECTAPYPAAASRGSCMKK